MICECMLLIHMDVITVVYKNEHRSYDEVFSFPFEMHMVH